MYKCTKKCVLSFDNILKYWLNKKKLIPSHFVFILFRIARAERNFSQCLNARVKEKYVIPEHWFLQRQIGLAAVFQWR